MYRTLYETTSGLQWDAAKEVKAILEAHPLTEKAPPPLGELILTPHVAFPRAGVAFLTLACVPLGFSAGMSLYEMPGCCGMCVLSGVSVNPQWRQSKIGTVLWRYAEMAAKKAGYTRLVFTSLTEIPLESAQWGRFHPEKWFEKMGFEQQDVFKSVRTGNTIGFWSKKIAG